MNKCRDCKHSFVERYWNDHRCMRAPVPYYSALDGKKYRYREITDVRMDQDDFEHCEMFEQKETKLWQLGKLLKDLMLKTFMKQ